MSESEKPRPEPSLRKAGVYDAEVISARIAELRKARERLFNMENAPPAPFDDGA